MGAEGGIGTSPPDRNLELLQLLPNSSRDSIPVKCRTCPSLQGRLVVYEMFKKSNDKDRKSFNPINTIGSQVSAVLSKAKLIRDVEDMTKRMEDCAAGPVNILEAFSSPEATMPICGVEVQNALVNQIQVTE